MSFRWAIIAAASVGVGFPGVAQSQQQIRLDRPAATITDLSSINGIVELSDGSILLSDGTGQALMKIDVGTGGRSSIDTLGSVGRGPDEYQGPDILTLLPGDSTLLVDLGNGRLTVITPNGDFSRTEPIARDRDGQFTMLLPNGSDSRGNLYFSQMQDSPTGVPERANIVRWDATSARLTRLGSVGLGRMSQRSSDDGGGGQSQEIVPVPLAPRDVWAVASDGRVVVARWADYHLEWINPDGTVTTGPAIAAEPIRITSRDKDAWIAGLANSLGVDVEDNGNGPQFRFGRGMRGSRPDADSFDWPDAKPVFTRVIVDDMGMAWVERSVPFGNRAHYDIFDSRAQLVATVTLQPGRTVLAVTARRVYVDSEDEMGLRILGMYRRPSIAGN